MASKPGPRVSNMELVKALRMSLAMKKKSGWSRDVSAGFIAEDIKDSFIAQHEKGSVFFEFQDARKWVAEIRDLNVRELEELILWAEAKDSGVDIETVRTALHQAPPPLPGDTCKGYENIPIHVPHSGHRPAGHRCGEGHVHCFRCLV